MKNQDISALKRQYYLKFLDSLISNPKFKPFLHFDNQCFGFFDVFFITKSKGLSILALRKEVKTRRIAPVDWFAEEVRKIFVQVSEYVLLDDPLQDVCQEGLRLVLIFEKDFAAQFKRTKNPLEKEQVVQGQRIPSIGNQLRMLFYLKNYENDQEIVRKIGQAFEIASQTEEEYILNLGANIKWESMIRD